MNRGVRVRCAESAGGPWLAEALTSQDGVTGVTDLRRTMSVALSTETRTTSLRGRLLGAVFISVEEVGETTIHSSGTKRRTGAINTVWQVG